MSDLGAWMFIIGIFVMMVAVIVLIVAAIKKANRLKLSSIYTVAGAAAIVIIGIIFMMVSPVKSNESGSNQSIYTAKKSAAEKSESAAKASSKAASEKSASIKGSSEAASIESASASSELAKSESQKASQAQEAQINSQNISYGMLIKSDDNKGKAYIVSGSVLQAQSDSGMEMLLVDATGNGDYVEVIVNGKTNAVEDSTITAQGVLGKRDTYDTQAGGSNTVPTLYVDDSANVTVQ
ncbi:hypothetical protein [Weissella cibaria]|uniref:TcdA-E operon negative regulator n=1 Tax=Weissella cibaria TaxID=137591 RepID=A0A2S1KU44_9LACO|nr:hypothetical protein [Weissella cibaria]AWF96515.1 hypothetical protein B6254_2155 [Weissella cibaria]